MDNTEKLLVETLQRHAEDAPRPSNWQPDQRPKRNRGTLMAATMTAVVLASAGATGYVVLQRANGDAPRDVATVPPTQTPSSVSAAPLSGRLIALGDAVLPVPDQWTINDIACGVPHSNTVSVILPGTPHALCGLGRANGVSDIQLWKIDDPRQVAATADAQPSTALDDGTPALIGHKPSDFPGYTTTTLVVPDLGVIAIGTSPLDDSLDDEMLRLTGMPADRVAVPDLTGQTLASARQALADLALRVNVHRQGAPRDHGSVAHMSPAPNLAIPREASVKLTLSSGR